MKNPLSLPLVHSFLRNPVGLSLIGLEARVVEEVALVDHCDGETTVRRCKWPAVVRWGRQVVGVI